VSQEQTEAIVLKAIDFSETSRIVTFLTPDRGRLTCMAKGVKRPKSQLSGLLDTFNRVELVYLWKESRSVQQMTDGTLLERYAGIKKDLDKSMYGAFLIEMLYRVAHDNEPSHDLFDTYVDGITHLDDWTGDVCVHVCWQIIRLLTVSGFSPTLHECCHCGESIQKDAGFSYDGGVTCSECISDVTMDRGTYQTLLAIGKGTSSPKLKGGEKVFQLLRHFTGRQLECDFRSARVIEQMVNA
jgi:DNA repair protein RecO (recombination protein O)